MEDSSSSNDSSSSDATFSPLVFNMPDIAAVKEKIRKFSFFKNIFNFKNQKKIEFSTSDVIAVIFFTFLSIFTRCFRIYYPKTVVFDEKSFGNFINNYIKGDYFDDIHPPLAKLILAGCASLSEYEGDFEFQKLFAEHKEFSKMSYVSLRMIPAIMSGIVAPLSYIAAKLANLSSFTSFVVGIFTSLDLLFIVEGKYILTDGILHMFCMLAIVSVFLFERKMNFYTLLFEGFCLGAAISVKFTAGGIVVFAIAMQFDIKELISNPMKQIGAIKRSIILIITALTVLYITFYIHLSILPYESDHYKFAPDIVKSALVNRANPEWMKRYNVSMFRRIVALIISMLKYNFNIKPRNSYATKWYQWPLQTSSLLLMSVDRNRSIYSMGNILIWIPVFFSVIASTINCIIQNDCSSTVFYLLVGYFASYLPFALMTRDTYIYHYCIPLLFGYLCLAINIDKFSPKYKGFFSMLLIFLTIAGFLLWAPWAYGLTVYDFNFLVWNKKWPVGKSK